MITGGADRLRDSSGEGLPDSALERSSKVVR